MVVCAMQSFATEPQLNGCSALKSPQTAQSKNAAIVDNSNGADEDREEGEIVDDFEMIISSEDEEFKLRARIQQLEDKSKDIEKMEMLSANLANQYNFPRPQVVERYSSYTHFSPISILSDVSSLSGEEFEPPKRHRKHKMKRSEPKKHGQLTRRSTFSRSHSQQQQQLRRRRRHEHHSSYGNHYQGSQRYSNQHQESAILLDSLDSVTEDELVEFDLNGEHDSDDNDDLEQLKLSRNKLLVALGRAGNHDIKPKYSLKERLQYCPRKSGSPSARTPQRENKCGELLPPHSFDGYSKHRSEDELEAERENDEPAELKLRLIALKSAILKKHMARKKRDAERAYSPTDMINRVHQPTTINNTCDDIDDLMEISPAASPERTTYSPPPALCEEPVDMDLAQTDSDEEGQQWPQNWQGTLHSDSSWPCLLPHTLPPVSMPIVVDDDDDEEEELRRQQQFDEVPPPPPSYHIPHIQLEDDDARDALQLSDRQSQHGSITDIQSISMDNSETRPFPVESSDDEAGALRAMLLSKLKPVVKPLKDLATPKSDAQDSDDPEELRLLLLSSIATKKKPSQDGTAGDSPEILKNAVRRFQATTIQPSCTPQPVEAAENVQAPDNQTDREQSLDVPVSESVAESVPEPVTVIVTEPGLETLPLAQSVPCPVPLDVPSPAVSTSTPASTPTAPLPPAAANIIKIVKPNKVINKKTAPKRKISKVPNQVPPVKRPSTLLVKESVAPLHAQNAASSTRLITTLDPASIKVNKLIITLAESSAGSDDELELKDSHTYSSYTSYADNASPLSQALESASNSTTRSNTPNSEILESTTPSNPSLRRTVINEYFEKKLDDYLKQARSKVPTASPLASATTQTTTEVAEITTELQTAAVPPQPTAQVPQKAKPTPVAVRHLPVASQREYLRLVERMRLLEKKKIGGVKAKTNGEATKAATTVKMIKKATVKTGGKSTVAAAPSLVTVVETSKKDTSHCGTSIANGEVASTSGSTSKASQKPSKESRLKAFENSFLKIGGSMITNLDKSLHMVEDARRSKIARLRHSQRLKELHAEMLSVKQTLKLEEARLARIQPEIQASHEIIISLKQRRNKLRKAATDLGTDLQGADYRLLDPAKAEISRKSTQLTKEIRLYNTLHKYEDIVPSTSESTSKVNSTPAAKPICEDVPTTVPGDATKTAPQPKENDASQVQVAENCTQTDVIQKPGECDNAAPKDVDMTPQDAASKNVPLYVANFMRFLRHLPYEDTLLGEYRTPMSRNYNSQQNVYATLCPFDLMGRCEDADCSYLHLTRAESAARLDVNITASAD